MKFGKVENIEGIDFTLPPDHASVAARKSDGSHPTPNFYIGCTAWTSKEWKGKYYPEKTKASEFLNAYGKQFNTIELNTTHYRTPKPELIDKWKAQTPDDFKFCPKVLQYISHSADLGIGTTRIKEFCNAIALFEGKLGMCFIQLPPYFGFDRLGLLQSFLDDFPQEIPLAFELRHASFYEGDNLSAVVDLLTKYDRTLLITDVSGRRDILHMALSSGTVMTRFVGNNLDKTDYSRIDDWVDRLNAWLACGLKDIYFFPHEPDNINAPEISEYLYKKLKGLNKFNVRGPKLLGQQKSLF